VRGVPKLEVAAVVCSYCALFGGVLYAWLEGGALALGSAIGCAVPALLAALVLGLHRGEVTQYLAKSTACLGMPPILLLFWAAEVADAGRVMWPAMTAFAVGHALAFLLFVLWAAKATTRVAARGAAVSQELLCARLCSLPATGLPCTVAREPTHLLTVDYHCAPGVARSLRFMLELDPVRHTVHVREREGASGAAPRDAAEADMRPIGSVGIDPTRPNAQAVYGTTTNTTILEPDRLAALPIALTGEHASLPEAFARAADGTQLAYVLAAVVSRSGWAYQPILFRFQRD
jgi:hypothetical protein